MLAPEYGAISAPAAKRSNHSPSEIHRWHSGSIGTSAVPEGRGLGEGCSWFGATTTLLICVMFYATVVPCIVVAATYLLAERAVQQRGPVSSAGEAELVGHVPFQFDWIRSITSVCIAVLVLVFYVVVVLFIEANCRCFTSQLKRRLLADTRASATEMFQEGIHSAACSLWRQFLGDPTAGVFSNASTKLSNPEEKSVKSRSVDCASGAQMERQFVVDEANEVQTSCERLQHVEGREALSPFALAVITICRGKGHGVVDHEKIAEAATPHFMQGLDQVGKLLSQLDEEAAQAAVFRATLPPAVPTEIVTVLYRLWTAMVTTQEEDVARGLAIAATELLGTDGAMKWLLHTIKLCANPNTDLIHDQKALGFENAPEAQVIHEVLKTIEIFLETHFLGGEAV